MDVFAGLSPEPVWRHFAQVCTIPHPSHHEDALRQHVKAWAATRKIGVAEDAAGNLLLTKPANPSRSDRPGVILQAHLDMVGEAVAGSSHDFTRDPIRPQVDQGWVLAPGTTLGADNGIGIALALAALEDETLVHPPLEVLLTTDEECGMGGARALAPGWLQGRVLLNLDTEAWGEFFVGCAGGCDVTVSGELPTGPGPVAAQGWRLSVGGLAGGHSGCDIALGRGNANKILVSVLQALAQRFPLHLRALAGGNARNAIPRDAWADVALPAGVGSELDAFLDDQRRRIQTELGAADPGFSLVASAAPVGPGVSGPALARLLASTTAAPCGVRRFSTTFPGVVETSNNLGVMRLENGSFSANLMVRSLVDAETERLGEEIKTLFTQAGFHSEVSGFYPGWEPQATSALLALCREVFAREFGTPAGVQVIHAGLECGLIGAKYPGLDIVSFGPTIVGPHAPGERVEIASVTNAWTLLKALLAAL